ncbi:hypothetical protein ACFPK9_00845 [Rubritalea spongiae]|uniref:Uncharacterized protein n=1 Tax=Rubritalea spongiae TaxID=430797 RepID=A0ABW5E6P9_9BACT
MSITSNEEITISSNFFMCNGERWSPKGVCYQPTDGVDPISDTQENISVITKLVDPSTDYGFVAMGINAIRVYQVDPSQSHSKVMKLLADAGIYVLVGCVNSSVTVLSGLAAYNQRLQAIADEFCQYSNVMGFSIGNETIGSAGQLPGYGVPNRIRAGAKALKAYMASQNYRAVPVSAALRDDPQYTIPAALAYMCGDASERLDFVGYNCERWAGGPTSAKVDAYYKLAQAFVGKNPVPIVFTEFGSNPVDFNPRDWDQVPYLYGVKEVKPTSGSGSMNMADVVSGGFAFRYYNRTAGWGMLKPDGTLISGSGGDKLGPAYKAVTSLTGTANSLGTVACDPTNPYVIGWGPTISVNVSNAISPATQVAWSFTTDATILDSTVWHTLLTMDPGDPVTSVQVPTKATFVSLSYQDTADPTQWYGGCSISMSSISAGSTIQGEWVAPNGTGTCSIG